MAKAPLVLMLLVVSAVTWAAGDAELSTELTTGKAKRKNADFLRPSDASPAVRSVQRFGPRFGSWRQTRAGDKASSPQITEPPVNSYLADSAWPMSHRNPYNQASSPYAGPTTSTNLSSELLPGDPVPITLAISGRYPGGGRAIWGATLKNVFKVTSSDGKLKYLAKTERLQSQDEAISGAYSLIDRDGTFFVPRGPTIEAFRDAVPGKLASEIVKAREFVIPADILPHDDDAIVGLNMTFDGFLVFVTRCGLVGAVSRDFAEFAWLALTLPPDTGRDVALEISNSIAVDETGGVYVVTNRTMNRVQFSRDEQPSLSLEWSAAYQTTDEQSPGRLGTGSGTTPTLMGFGDQDQFVVIADGQALMHIVLFWRGEIPADWQGLPGRDRRIAAEYPVTFGDADAVVSTTEQSLTVRGYEIAAVSNRYGELPRFFKRFARKRMGNDIGKMTIYRSNHPSIAPYGVEKFVWDPQRRSLRTAWSNPAISCPNGIPTMSEATGLMYCIGQRDGCWTMEAIDWDTGKSAFHNKLAKNADFNSFYAATEIGGDANILTGTFGGLLNVARDESQEDSVAIKQPSEPATQLVLRRD